MVNTIAIVLGSVLMLGSAYVGAAPAKRPTDVQQGKSGETGLIHVATCNDGKEYWAKTNEHRGACSGHGGVASWTDGSPVKAKGRKTSYRFDAIPASEECNHY
jgi:hypothetical protein